MTPTQQAKLAARKEAIRKALRNRAAAWEEYERSPPPPRSQLAKRRLEVLGEQLDAYTAAWDDYARDASTFEIADVGEIKYATEEGSAFLAEVLKGCARLKREAERHGLEPLVPAEGAGANLQYLLCEIAPDKASVLWSKFAAAHLSVTGFVRGRSLPGVDAPRVVPGPDVPPHVHGNADAVDADPAEARPLGAWAILRTATSRVPGGKWIWGPVGLAAAGAIGLGLYFGSGKLAFFGTAMTLAFTILFYVFVKGAVSRTTLATPLLVLVWGVTVLFVVVLGTLYSCVFWRFPIDLSGWIEEQAKASTLATLSIRVIRSGDTRVPVPSATVNVLHGKTNPLHTDEEGECSFSYEPQPDEKAEAWAAASGFFPSEPQWVGLGEHPPLVTISLESLPPGVDGGATDAQFDAHAETPDARPPCVGCKKPCAQRCAGSLAATFRSCDRAFQQGTSEFMQCRALAAESRDACVTQCGAR